MKTDRLRNIAAGKVLDTLGKDAKVDSIQVDGKNVDLDAARAAIAAAEHEAARPPSPAESKLDKFTDKLQGKVDDMTASLAKTKAGRAINAILQSDPEKVTSRAVVDVRMANGTSFSVHVDVVDPRWTAFLQKCSLTAELGSLVPIVGTLGLAGASIASLIGSLIAYTVGDKALGSAMLRTSAKHLALAGADIVPVLGDAAAAIAAVIDSGNLKGARGAGAPSVAQIVDLASLVEAQQKS